MIIFDKVQQGSDEWLKLRWWVLTWTKLKGALWWKQAQLTQIYELIWEEFAPLEETYKSPYMERGNELEPIAKAKFEDLYKKKITEIWFCKSEKFKDKYWEWLWFSPDWLIEIDWKYKEAVEIKCPWGKNFVKYSIEWVIPAEYYDQILTYFLVNEDLERLYFIVFHPDFYLTDKKMKVIEITRDEIKKDLEEIESKLLDFRELWILNIKKLQW